jgi:ATP-binding cassette, subfamily B, bacterial PglK
MKSLLKITHVKPREMRLIIFLNAIAAAAELVSISSLYFAMQYFIDGALPKYNPLGVPEYFTAQYLTILVLTSQVILFSCRTLVLSANIAASQKTRKDLTLELTKKTIYQPYSFLKNAPKDDLAKNILNDTDIMMNSITMQLFAVITATTSITAIFGFLMLANPIGAAATLLFFSGIYFGIFTSLRKRVSRISETHNRLNKQRYKRVGDVLRNFRLIIVNRTDDEFFSGFYAELNLFAVNARSLGMVSAIPRFAIEAIMICATVLLLFLYRDSQNSLNVAFVGAMFYGALRTLPQIQVIYSALTTMKSAKPALREILNLIDAPSQSYPRGITFGNTSDIIVKQLGYAIAKKQVLQDVNFRIGKGEKILIKGLSGSGKSTLAEILVGLERATEGDVIYPKHFQGDAFFQNLSYVPQRPLIFNKSIFENVSLSPVQSAANVEKFHEVMKLVCLDDWATPYLFENPESDFFESISGGQLQRISLARALYHAPEFLILDEATSALDEQTELKILQNLFSTPITIAFVSHRPATFRFFNRALLVENGTTTEQLLGASN